MWTLWKIRRPVQPVNKRMTQVVVGLMGWPVPAILILKEKK